MNSKVTLADTSKNFEGKVLLATNQLDGSEFEKALILIWGHDQDGALGIVFNKQIGTFDALKVFDELIPADKPATSYKYPLFYGGPVEEDRLLVLSVTEQQKKLFANMPQMTVYDNAKLYLKDTISGELSEYFMLITGYCSWAPGQLEEELEENSWILISAPFDLIFGPNPKKKWNAVLKDLNIKDIKKFVHYSGSA